MSKGTLSKSTREQFTSGKSGLIISALSSSAGKTVISAALGRLLSRRGLDVGMVKLGPDYIDTGFHSAALGTEALNLDLWAMSPGLQNRILGRGRGLTIFEGVMGLFDGRLFSTADAAKRLNLAVILILDVRSSAQTPIHIAKALMGKSNIVGVILNRVQSHRHLRLLEEEAEAQGVKVFGALPTDRRLEIGSRHLGLLQAKEVATLDAQLDKAAELLEERLRIDDILKVALPLASPVASPLAPASTSPLAGEGTEPPSFRSPGKRIAVARDEAFSFTYPWFLDSWAARAELSYFSPLADQPPPSEADFIYLPGGYPELHPKLGRAKAFFAGLRRAKENGAWIYGECGGFMALGEEIITADGGKIPMVGLLKFSSRMHKRLRAVNYHQLRLGAKTALGDRGSVWRGHEFRYAEATNGIGRGGGDIGGNEPLFLGEDGGDHGIIDGRVFGSFIHLIDSAILGG